MRHEQGKGETEHGVSKEERLGQSLGELAEPAKTTAGALTEQFLRYAQEEKPVQSPSVKQKHQKMMLLL